MFKDALVIVLPVITTFSLHYVSENVYAKLCTPLSITGLFQSAAFTASPVCSTVLTVVNQTQNAYSGFVIGFGAYCMKHVLTMKSKPSRQNDVN